MDAKPLTAATKKPEWKPPKTEVFAFRDVRGPKEKVLALVKDAKAPEEVKAYLAARLEKSPFEGVVLDAQGHERDGLYVEHVSISQLY